MKAVAADPKLLESAPFIAATLPLLEAGQYQGNLTDPDQLAYEIVYPNILAAVQGSQSAQETADKINTEANAMVDAAQ
jgi:hypothetical protein